MSQYGITLGYEKDKCSICNEEKEIRHVYDKDGDNSKLAKVCDDCVSKHPDMTIKEMIDKYGAPTTEKDIEILTKEEMESKGFDVQGLKEESS